MNKIATTGRRYLKDDVWHDANGPLPDSPAAWEPPMTDEEVEQAARTDPDAQPLTDEQLAGMRQVSFAKHVRWKLGLSLTDFAARFAIPVDTLRAWERHDAEPDAAAVAYLRVISEEPDSVSRALARSSGARTDDLPHAAASEA